MGGNRIHSHRHSGADPAKRGQKLPLLSEDDLCADRNYINEFIHARRRALGQKNCVQYAETFHYIGGDSRRSAVEAYVKKNAVPMATNRQAEPS